MPVLRPYDPNQASSAFRLGVPFVPQPNPSILQRIGRFLDTPGRWLRSGLTGRPEATGRDVLKMLGVRRPGFWGGLGTEIALDPLNLLAGVGGLTKAGRLAKTLEATGRQVRTLQTLRKATANADVAADLANQLRGVIQNRREVLAALRNLGPGTAMRAAPTWGAQARAGQRALVHVGVPFGPSVPLIRGAPVLERLGRVGSGIRALGPVAGLERILRSPGRRMPAILDVTQPAATARIATVGRNRDRVTRFAQRIDELAQESGLPREEFLRKFRETQEALDVLPRFDRAAQEAQGQAQALQGRVFNKASAERLRKASEDLREIEKSFRTRQTFARRLVGGEQELRMARELLKREQAAGRAADRTLQGVEGTAGRGLGVLLPGERLARSGGFGDRLRRRLLGQSAKGRAARPGFIRIPSEYQKLQKTAGQLRRSEALVGTFQERADKILGAIREQAGKARGELAQPGLETIPKTSLPYMAAPRAAKFMEKAELSREKGYQRVMDYLERGPQKKDISRIEKIDEGLRTRLESIAKDREVVEKALTALPPESRAFARELFEETERTFAAQIAAGGRKGTIDSARLQSMSRQYAARVLTPEAQEFIRNNPDKAKSFWSAVDSRITTREGSQIRRGMFREEFTTAANDWLRKNGPEVDFDWFQLDPSKAVAPDLLEKEISTINATMLQSLAKQFQRPLKEGDVPLEEYLAKAPIWKYGDIAIGADKDRIAAQLSDAGLGGLGIPKEVFEEAKPLIKAFTSPEELRPLLDVYDRYMSMMRFSLTTPFLAFHTRNMTTNVVMNWLGGVSNPVWYVRALAEQKRLRNNPAEAARLYGAVLKGTQAEDILADFARTFRGREPGKLRKGVEAMGKMSRFVENNARLAHYLAKRNAGVGHYEALRSVNKYLFDYNDLTSAERAFGKRVAMFYQWTRNAVPRILGEYFENPRKMALLQRSLTRPGDERPLPSYMRRTLAIPYGDDGANKKYLLGLGLPLEELLKFDVFSETEPGGTGRAILRNLSALSATPIRAAMEMASGESFFLDKPILEADRAPTWMRFLPQGVQDTISFQERRSSSGRPTYRANPQLLWLMNQLPISRLSATVGKITDPRRTALDKIMNLISGARTTNLDPRVLELEGQKLATETALNQKVLEGLAGRFRGFFATGEAGEKSPEVKKLLQYLRAVGEQRKELLKERRY